MWQVRICSPEEMGRLGERLGRLLKPGAVVCLSGQLGAGKTVFTQGLARGLGVAGYVTSPTFTLLHEYQGRCPVYHLDVYRLDDPAEFAELGFQDYLGGDGVAVVEWPELIREYLPPEYLQVTIAGDDDNEDCRQVTIKAGGGYESAIEELKPDAGSGR